MPMTSLTNMFNGRSRSRNRKDRTYAINGNQMVDARSKQLLFNEFDVFPMGKTVLKEDEYFSDQTAHNLLEKHMKKKRSMNLMNFLVDRVRFSRKSGSGRGVTREYVNYREIKYFFRFSTQPTVFTLGIEEEESGKRSYETFMCKTIHDMEPIHELVRRTTADPHYILRQHVRTRQDASDSSSDSSLNQYERSILQNHNLISYPMENTKTVYSMYEEPENVLQFCRDRKLRTSPLLEDQNQIGQPDEICATPDLPLKMFAAPRYSLKSRALGVNPNHPISNNGYANHNIQQFDNKKPLGRSMRYRSQQELTSAHHHLSQNGSRKSNHRNYDSAASSEVLSTDSSKPDLTDTTWHSTVTYLSKNANRETQVSDRGPVFMYVSRTRRAIPLIS